MCAVLTGIATVGIRAQNPVFQARTRIVEIAVVAKDSRGEPVNDLALGDFQVFDNGVEQKIQSLDKLWDPPRAADGLPIGLPPNRPTIIVINAFGAPAPGGRDEIREAIAQMLHDLPQTVDRIEILSLGDELKTVHSFTPFTFTLRSSILQFEWPPATVPRPNQPTWILKLLSEVARRVKGIPGEKNLLWVGGFSVQPSVGVLAGEGRGGGLFTRDYYEDIAKTMHDLSAARVMFYPVEPHMIKPFELDDFAVLTGGKVYWEDKDLAGLLREAIDDSREGYMITYVPSNYQDDGSAHEVKVKVARKGIELRYRPGYSADPAVK